MRQGAFIAACAAATIFIATSGHAQVVINRQALEQLGGKPAAAEHHSEAVRRPAPARHTERARERHTERAPVRHAARVPLPLPPPPMPRRDDAAARLPQPPSLPPAPPQPKPAPRRLELRFAGTSSTLDAGASGALGMFMRAKIPAGARFIVQATAPGQPGDPSVARRLALARGMAVREVLRGAGIPPQRIIVQALGNPPGRPDDRVTLTELP